MSHSLIITPGETDGIGLEVTLKALSHITEKGMLSDKTFVFFASKQHLNLHINKLNLTNLKLNTCKSLETPMGPGVYWVDSSSSPFSWFSKAVEFCKTRPNQTAVITGPLRKSSFKESKSLGHTDYLRQRFSEPCFMTFFGDVYNSLLLSDHLPLSEVSNLDFSKLLPQALTVLQKFSVTKKIALLGLNPHAGEDGLIGSVDESFHKPFARSHKDLIEGPLPADSFFSLDTYANYSFLIANYHDQALIPFKLIHGFNGAQASLGLPIVRTSVDHGTGDDLYLQNKANPKSMLKAIDLAVDLLNLN